MVYIVMQMMNKTGPAGAPLASTSVSKALRQDPQEICIPVPSYGNIRQFKANRSLIEGTGEVYIKIGVPLFEASIKCDWKAAKAILDKNPELVRYSITDNGETALHVAASVKGSKHAEMFVENLMGRMESADLELVNDNSNTALCLAAAAGNIELVRIMLNKTPNGGQMMPLCMAVLFGKYNVVRYLYEISNNLCDDDGWNSENRGWLLEKCVEFDMFDVALKIVKSYRQLRSASVLGILAQKPKAFYERKLTIIERIINSIFALSGSKEGVYEKESEGMQLLKVILEDIARKPREEIYAILTGSLNLDEQRRFQMLFVAAEMGNTKFLVELIRQYPDLMLKTNDKNQTIFHIAVKQRHDSIYNLLYEIGAKRDLILALKDEDGNNMLHLVAKCTDNGQLENLSRAALQMQSDLLWFKEVEQMIPPIYRERKNKHGLTPHALFTNEHQHLVKKGEQWMKDAINYCVVVAALIATVTFVAASTIPGGYNQNNGIPIFYKKPAFVFFVVADAISLISSTTSILIFLSIITSRSAERDFLESLPAKLWIGISNLFVSVAAMMFTFNASFFILYHKEMQWIPVLISAFASMPVLAYGNVQYRILVDVMRSIYRSRYLFSPKKRSLYY